MLENLLRGVAWTGSRQVPFRFGDIRLGKSKRQNRPIDDTDHFPLAIAYLPGFLRIGHGFGLFAVKNDANHYTSSRPTSRTTLRLARLRISHRLRRDSHLPKS